MTIKDILAFGEKIGYNNLERGSDWRGFEVYQPVYPGKDIVYAGLPFVVLVKGDEIHLSTPEEALERVQDLPAE